MLINSGPLSINYIAEKVPAILDGDSRFLTQVKAFENGGDFLRNVVDGQRTAVNEHHDCRLACFKHRFNEIVLSADEIKAIAIAEMIVGPAFFVGVFVAAQHQQRKVRRLCHLDCLRDQFGVFRWIAQV